VTFLSALILGATSVVAGIISSLLHKIRSSYAIWNFWLISSLGFFYLCLDEFFMIHEGMDRAILESLGYDRLAWNFDGWILGFLGVVGMIIFLKALKELRVFKDFFCLFILAAVFFVGMVFSDQFLSDGYPGILVEDGFKLAGVTLFFGAYLAALDGVHNKMRV